MEMIDNNTDLLGDVDKFVVRIKQHKGLSSEHYLFASSLLTVNDSKTANYYTRTFRYVFTGTINQSDAIQRFLDENGLKNNQEVKSYIKTEGLLLGHLTIIVETSQQLSDIEVTLLNGLKELSEQKKEYLHASVVEAASMERLASLRTEMVNLWHYSLSTTKRLEKVEENQRPFYSFDVLLTRDGILLLKDQTPQVYRNHYAAPGSADDYTQNVPIHRVFKLAMNYVKYLFHFNYHHNQEHDTYLPASNLHPITAVNPIDISPAFRHQIEAFLVPITMLKRKEFNVNSIDANGILLYAKAFVKINRDNQFISHDSAQKSLEHINLLQDEIEFMMKPRNNLFNTVMAQHNWIIFIPAIFAIFIAFLEIVKTCMRIPQLELSEITMESIRPYAAMVAIAFVCLFTIYYISYERICRKTFKHKKISSPWWIHNSNLHQQRFSLSYKIYIWLTGRRIHFNLIWKRLQKEINPFRLFYPLALVIILSLLIKGILLLSA
ncbi:MAG: hypothetical protein IJ614_08485 [Prevotella sp.]|nr:hypothetical protein [Prevotella sp.]